MHENAYRILNQSLTEAVAPLLVEERRKNRISMVGMLVFGAASIIASIAWVDARDRTNRLGEAWEILAAGFAPRAPIALTSPLLMQWTLEDGTVMMVNLPSLPIESNL